MSPNLDTYREAIPQGNKHFHDIYKPATLDDLIHKRVRGQAISRLAQSCQKMVKAGFTPLMIVAIYRLANLSESDLEESVR
jgi:hypothetical protein